MITLAPEEARRLAVRASGLAGGPRTPLDAALLLGDLQLDPTRIVERSHLLVLWSRLGPFDRAELDRVLWEDRLLFEYNAFVVPVRDVATHAARARIRWTGDAARPKLVRRWLADNAEFVRYVLGEIDARGPLRSRELEDRAAVPWRSGGWNDGKKNTGRMLEVLHQEGRLLVAGREGNERFWDLPGRIVPAWDSEEPITVEEAARRDLRVTARAQGIVDRAWLRRYGRSAWGPPGALAVDELTAAGELADARVDGRDERWLVTPDLLDDTAFEPRTTLLSPFDNLIRNRERAAALFGFEYRLELYVSASKRLYGPYTLPVLSGDELVGRVDLVIDRQERALRVEAVHPEPGRTLDVDDAFASLASFLGADEVVAPGRR